MAVWWAGTAIDGGYDEVSLQVSGGQSAFLPCLVRSFPAAEQDGAIQGGCNVPELPTGHQQLRSQGSLDVSVAQALAKEEKLAEGSPTPTGIRILTPVLEHESGKGGLGQGYEAVAELILSTFGSAEGERALKVATCESGSDLYAAPAENLGHRGVFQLGKVHAPRFERRGWDWDTDGLIPERNIVIANELFLDQGWRPWRFSASCHGVY